MLDYFIVQWMPCILDKELVKTWNCSSPSQLALPLQKIERFNGDIGKYIRFSNSTPVRMISKWRGDWTEHLWWGTHHRTSMQQKKLKEAWWSIKSCFKKHVLAFVSNTFFFCLSIHGIYHHLRQHLFSNSKCFQELPKTSYLSTPKPLKNEGFRISGPKNIWVMFNPSKWRIET